MQSDADETVHPSQKEDEERVIPLDIYVSDICAKGLCSCQEQISHPSHKTNELQFLNKDNPHGYGAIKAESIFQSTYTALRCGRSKKFVFCDCFSNQLTPHQSCTYMFHLHFSSRPLLSPLYDTFGYTEKRRYCDCSQVAYPKPGTSIQYPSKIGILDSWNRSREQKETIYHNWYRFLRDKVPQFGFGRRSIFCIWVCVCVAGAALGV